MPGKTLQQTWQYNPVLDAPKRYRRACRYSAFLPDPLADLDLDIDGRVSGAVSEAESRIHELNANARHELAPLARLLLRTESIASSKIEGMQLGARELARAEAKLETGQRIGETPGEILANINAMELAVGDAAVAERFAAQHIRQIHARLMSTGPNRRNAGAVRTQQNWIGGNDYNPCGADFVPPPPEHVAKLLEDLCEAINDDFLPPVIQAALVHAQFETIHPFDDGNGRTGRALIHVVLRRRGLAPAYVPPISIVLSRSRDRYISALTSFRGESMLQWIEYFANAAAESASLAFGYLQAVDELVSIWRDRLSATPNPPRADATAWAIIEALPALPMLTAPVASAATKRSKARVYEAIAQLEDAGILAALTNAKRNQVWEAAGLLDLIEGLEDGRMRVTG